MSAIFNRFEAARADDERDLFPAILDLADQLKPRAILIENVRGLLGSKFDD